MAVACAANVAISDAGIPPAPCSSMLTSEVPRCSRSAHSGARSAVASACATRRCRRFAQCAARSAHAKWRGACAMRSSRRDGAAADNNAANEMLLRLSYTMIAPPVVVGGVCGDHGPLVVARLLKCSRASDAATGVRAMATLIGGLESTAFFHVLLE
eukprot:IDg18684t1